MKHIKRFNESIEEKDLQETIDEILDKLSKSGELSKSEKEFMDEASNGTITKVTTPKPSGNFWADMSNPHNSGILWVGKDKVWNQLKSIEDEELDEIDNIEDSDLRWKKQGEYKLNKMSKELPNLKELLNKYALELLDIETKYNNIVDKNIKELLKLASNKDKNFRYDFNSILKEPSRVSTLDKLFNRFGSLIDSVEYDSENGDYKKK